MLFLDAELCINCHNTIALSFNIAIRRFPNESFKTLLQRAHMECDWLLRGFQSFEDKEQIITRQPFRGLDCTQDVKLGKAVPPDSTNDPFTRPSVLLTLPSVGFYFCTLSPSRLPHHLLCSALCRQSLHRPVTLQGSLKLSLIRLS